MSHIPEIVAEICKCNKCARPPHQAYSTSSMCEHEFSVTFVQGLGAEGWYFIELFTHTPSLQTCSCATIDITDAYTFPEGIQLKYSPKVA